MVYVCGLVGALGKWTLLDLHRWEGEPEGIVRRLVVSTGCGGLGILWFDEDSGRALQARLYVLVVNTTRRYLSR